MDLKEMEAVIEGLLFAAGDPLPLERISEILQIDRKTTRLLLNNMIFESWGSSRGIVVREINSAYQLCTRAEHHEYIKKLFEPRQRQGLSQAAFETLAIVAYNQPVTKTKIEHIRGVNSDSAITRLLDRNLIREAGRLDSPGKPILYATTDEFLRSFGFRSVKDLPALSMNELQEVAENQPLE